MVGGGESLSSGKKLVLELYFSVVCVCAFFPPPSAAATIWVKPVKWGGGLGKAVANWPRDDEVGSWAVFASFRMEKSVGGLVFFL